MMFSKIKPVRHPRNLNHQQDAIIFLVETANMANDHHTGFDVDVHCINSKVAGLGTPCLRLIPHPYQPVKRV